MVNQSSLVTGIDLMFDRFRNVPLCSTKFSLNSTEAHFYTGQTGGQPYSDTFSLQWKSLSVPCK